MTTSIKLPALTFNQRYIYNYYLYHKRNHKHSPCFVPKSPRSEDKLQYYLRALDKLEAAGFISVDRTASNYMAWIIKDPVRLTSQDPGQTSAKLVFR